MQPDASGPPPFLWRSPSHNRAFNERVYAEVLAAETVDAL